MGERRIVQPHLLLRCITPEQRGPGRRQAHWSPKVQGPADHMGSPQSSPRGPGSIMNSLFVFNCSINWRQTEFSVVADSGTATMFDVCPVLLQ